MQGIMRNISLHLLHLCDLGENTSCVQKLKGQKCLSIIILRPQFPFSSLVWYALNFEGQSYDNIFRSGYTLYMTEDHHKRSDCDLRRVFH